MSTCIWRDLFENRIDKFRPLGEWAFELLKKARKEKIIIISSRLVEEELLKYFTINEIEKILEQANKKVNYGYEESFEANKLSKKFKTPFVDTLHAVIAKKNKATLITRDKHLYELEEFVDVKKPEDLL